MNNYRENSITFDEGARRTKIVIELIGCLLTVVVAPGVAIYCNAKSKLPVGTTKQIEQKDDFED